MAPRLRWWSRARPGGRLAAQVCRPTRDGPGIRNYVHVWDPAAAHPAAIERCDSILVGPKRSLSLEDGIRSALDWMPVRDELVKD
ncbi:hypothetical protein [Streptomyces sp. PTD9-10]|uniref:hypothetical protein n=1 Tax=Streptomyces sp. PTD9-10 TaxID=3120151 RepID=UPI00300A4EE7